MSSAPPSFIPGADGFALGDRVVRPSRNRIEGPAGVVTVEPKVMELLVCLARHGVAVVSKETLVREVWEGRFVTDDVVWRGIAELRRALGPEAIETIPRRGYRLRLAAAPLPAEAAVPRAVEPPLEPALAAAPPPPVESPPAALRSPSPRRAAWTGWALGLVASLGLAGLMVALRSEPRRVPPRVAGRTEAALPPAASAAYLEGLYFLNRGTPDELEKSRAAFTRAVAAAPVFAPAQAGLADALHLLTLFGRLAPATGYPAAEAAARRALALNPQDGETRATLGSILLRYHLDWAGASAELARARGLAPQSARVHHDSAWLYVDLGRFDQGLAEIERARRLDPLSLRANADVGWVLYRARRPREAAAEMRRLLRLEPHFAMARLCLERALLSLGEVEAARATAREGLLAAGLPSARAEALTAGPPAEALRRVAAFRLEQTRGGRGAVSAYAEAAYAAELGETEVALQALDRAFAERDPARADLGVDPAFDPLRPDPRFAVYVARLGRPAGETG